MMKKQTPLKEFAFFILEYFVMQAIPRITYISPIYLVSNQ